MPVDKRFYKLAFPVLVSDCHVERKDNGDGTFTEMGIVDAIVNVFGNIDDGDDRVWNGAFTKTIQENFGRFRVLDNHRTGSTKDAVGKPLEVRELGRNELPDDVLQKAPSATGGLFTSTQYMLDDPDSAAVFRRLRDGVISEYSIGFNIMESGWSKVKMPDGKEKSVRDIKQIRLWEYSPVLWGMNPATATADVKNNELEGENMPTENKEHTGEGPQRRMGAYLTGGVHGKYMSRISCLYADGYMSDGEYQDLNAGGNRLLDLMNSIITPDIANRPMLSIDWYYMANGVELDVKTLREHLTLLKQGVQEGEFVSKAGRVLSAANASKIVSAVDSLVEVLTAAGVYDTVDDESEDEESPKSKAAPSETRTNAGNEQLRKRLMLLELEALEHEHDYASSSGGRAQPARTSQETP